MENICVICDENKALYICEKCGNLVCQKCSYKIFGDYLCKYCGEQKIEEIEEDRRAGV